jgi:hypothetical protein
MRLPTARSVFRSPFPYIPGIRPASGAVVPVWTYVLAMAAVFGESFCSVNRPWGTTLRASVLASVSAPVEVPLVRRSCPRRWLRSSMPEGAERGRSDSRAVGSRPDIAAGHEAIFRSSPREDPPLVEWRSERRQAASRDADAPTPFTPLLHPSSCDRDLLEGGSLQRPRPHRGLRGLRRAVSDQVPSTHLARKSRSSLSRLAGAGEPTN